MGKQTANTEGIGEKVRDSAKFEIARVDCIVVFGKMPR